MSTKKNILPLIISVIVLGLPFLMMLQGQTSKESSNPIVESKKPTPSIDGIKKNFPSVEYSNEQVVDEAKKVKGEKYNKYKILDPDVSEDAKETSFAHWLITDSPLPVAESEVIVIGKVVDAQAHLSGNKNSVYSEFKIEIEKILKNSNQQEFENGKYLYAEREGGIVRFPSGKETWYFVSGQQMPIIGSRYVFFLTNEFPLYGRKKDLFLKTGYELKKGKAFPLDNPDGGTHPVATFYKGKDESVLLDDLQNALKNSKNILPK